MAKILLVCSAGMSTSLLVEKMKVVAKEKGFDDEIIAVPAAEGTQILNDYDVILLGPQVAYMLANFQKLTTKPLAIIPQKTYALAKGDEALLFAHQLLDDQSK